MGKPYLLELQQLQETYAVAMGMNISSLERQVLSATSLPLYTTGSGGSLSVAYLIAFLHQRLAKQFAKAVTPLEAIALPAQKGQCSFWFLSAGGRNADINYAFKDIVLKEPKQLTVTCARVGSPLVRFANNYTWVDVFDFDLPAGRDGFLATNSLLAFVVLAARAYQHIFLPERTPPQSIWDLLKFGDSVESYLSRLRGLCNPLWERNHILVLFGPSTQPAAIDFESKFTEAALGSVLLSDYRNFAHGRHHWLAKHGTQSAVLALSTCEDQELADKTLQLLPQDIKVVHLDFSWYDDTIYGPIAALVTVLYLAALAGEAHNIDPGRPGVPAFGRKIYHLRGLKRTQTDLCINSAIRRKAFALFNDIRNMHMCEFERMYRRFVLKLQAQRFSSIVFDYDGTLCAPKNRFGCIDNNIASEIERLIEARIPIGIATGRGKSVRDSLRKALPESSWHQVLIGYYNGAECGLLNDDTCPDGTDIPCTDLAPLVKVLANHNILANHCLMTIRKHQVTIEVFPPLCLDKLWALVNILAHQHGTAGTKVVISGHSVDILASGVSKTRVTDVLIQLFEIGTNAPILCIGDCGLWPGNDHELLQSPFSLSVDEVSPDLDTCWNLAPSGYRGIQATLYYLHCIQVENGRFSFKLPRTGKLG